MASLTLDNRSNSDEPFDGIAPSKVIPLLLALPASDCFQNKAFWKTYSKWENLSVEQKNKTMAFWQKLTVDVRQRLIIQANENNRVEQDEENNRQAMTNKHDKARLLHLRVDPGAAADWTAALREKTRAELDVVNSSQAADADPYNRLAEKFNDYENYKYQNAVILSNRNVNGLYEPLPGMEELAKFCFDINPSSPGRPIRDAGWIRTQYRDLKGKISTCFSSYHRSGNQDAENIYDEWITFSTGFNLDVVTNARALFTDTEMDQLGRALPTAVQRDTGGIETDDTYDIRKRAAEDRKRQRAEKRARLRGSGSPESLSSVSQSGNSSVQSSAARSDRIAEAVRQGMEEANQVMREAQKRTSRITLLQLILQHGTEEQKAEALNKMIALEAEDD